MKTKQKQPITRKRIVIVCVGALVLVLADITAIVLIHFLFPPAPNPTLKVEDRAKLTKEVQSILDSVNLPLQTAMTQNASAKCDANGEWGNVQEECHILGIKYYYGIGNSDDALSTVKQAVSGGYMTMGSPVGITYNFYAGDGSRPSGSSILDNAMRTGEIPKPQNGEFVYGVEIIAPFYSCNYSYKYICPYTPGDLIVHGAAALKQ